MNRKIVLSIFATAILMSGCASIVSQSSWPVAIKSNPDQAKFTITNQKGDVIHTGITPSTVSLSSGAGYFDGESYKIKFSREGYDDTISTLDSKINGWYFGNFLFGGLIGLLVIDPSTGAMWKLPESIQQELPQNKHSELLINSNDFSIISINDVPKNQRDKLIKLN